MRSLYLLLVFFLISLNSHAGNLCLVQKCKRAADQGLKSCRSTLSGKLFFLNDVSSYTKRIEILDWLVTFRKCSSEGESLSLYEGENTLRYSPTYPTGSVSTKAGEWSSGKAYLTIDGRKTYDLCSWRWWYDKKVSDSVVTRYPRSESELYHCRNTTYSFLLGEVDPELLREFENAKHDVNKLKEDAEKFYDEINIEINILSDVFNDINGVDFDSISAVDLDRVKQALSLYNDLKGTLDGLRLEIEADTKSFIDSMGQLERIVDEILADESVNPAEFEVYQPLIIPEIKIPVVVDDYTYHSDNNFYKDYADSILSELEASFMNDDRDRVLAIVKAWLVTTGRMRNNLQDQTYQSPAEWSAFMISFDRVDQYLFGSQSTSPKLDRDLWFSDSPVSIRQREAIGEIKEYYSGEGTIIEREVKTWRGQTLTQEQERMLESFKALSHVLKASVNGIQDTLESVNRIVAGAAIAVKEGVKCISIASVAGDYGDFYEVTTGINICTGEQLSNAERVLSAVGLVAGSGAVWRAVDNASDIIASTRHVARLSASIIEKGNKLSINKRKDMEELVDVINARYTCPIGV